MSRTDSCVHGGNIGRQAGMIYILLVRKTDFSEHTIHLLPNILFYLKL